MGFKGGSKPSQAADMGVAAPNLMADEQQKPAKKNIVPPVKKQGK
jgi:hypothetical protein